MSLRALLGCCSLLVGCSGLTREPLQPGSAEDFLRASETLHSLAEVTARERTQTVQLSMSAPYLPSEVSSRGAVALRPPGELRMILLGPGGATALDVWISGQRYRLEIPALERVVSGGTDAELQQERGLPIGFLRWWLLHPFSAQLQAARPRDGGLELLLRDEDGAWIEVLLQPGGEISATRSSLRRQGGEVVRLDEETVHASKAGCGEVRYSQRSTRLTSIVRCESERATVNAKAFEEPQPVCRGPAC